VIAFDDLWPRSIRRGDCAAWCGFDVVITLTRPFTHQEDAVFDWVTKQDSVSLIGWHSLEDGRDYMLFERLYSTQTREDAWHEHNAHLNNLNTVDILSVVERNMSLATRATE